MTEIVFDTGFPEILKEPISVHLSNLSWLFPHWLQRLYIAYNSSDADDDSGYAIIHKEYRWGRITICGAFARHTATHQKEVLVHEIIHLFNLPFVNYVRETIELLCPKEENEQFNNALRNETRRKMEAMTEDLTFVICQKIASFHNTEILTNGKAPIQERI